MIPFARVAAHNDGTAPGARVTATFTALEAELITDLAGSIAELLGSRARSPQHDPLGGSRGDNTLSGTVGDALSDSLRDDALSDIVGMGGSDSAPTDPAIARLLPDAYGDDAVASREFRQFTERSLATRKVHNASVVIESLAADGGTVSLDDAGAQSWLKALSDIRLAIASRLGIEADDDEGNLDGDEALMLRDVYDWLAYVVESLLEAIEPEETDNA